MELYIKILNENAKELYENHGHFHDGDAGLDLYILEKITISSGETKLIKLGISCESIDGKAYYPKENWLQRKTLPLRGFL